MCLYLSLLSVSVSVPQHPPYPPGYYTQVTFAWRGVVPLNACKSVCVCILDTPPPPPFLPGHYAQVTFTWLGVAPLTACKSVCVCILDPPFLPGHYAKVTFTWLGVVPLTACKSVNVCVSVSQSSTTPPTWSLHSGEGLGVEGGGTSHCTACKSVCF